MYQSYLCGRLRGETPVDEHYIFMTVVSLWNSSPKDIVKAGSLRDFLNLETETFFQINFIIIA